MKDCEKIARKVEKAQEKFELNEKYSNYVNEFISNSIRILRKGENLENDIKTVLNCYEKVSTMQGPPEEMMKIHEGFTTIRILVFEKSSDSYDTKTIIKIESNLEEYFLENRYPRKKDCQCFFNYIREHVMILESYGMTLEELKNDCKNPHRAYYSTTR